MHTSQITRLQAYLRHSAAFHYRSFPVSPFTAYLHSSDDLIYFNYAIPDHPLSGDDKDAQTALEALRSVFIEHQRTPRFEWIAEYAPTLDTLLAQAGYSEESRLPLMLCTPDTLVMPPAVEGLTVTRLHADSPLAEAMAHRRVGWLSFDHVASEEEIQQQAQGTLQGLRDSKSGLYLGWWDGEVVAVATYSNPHDGLTELGGVGTLTDFRQRGIGAYLSAVATAAAFEDGVTLAILSAGNETATRVYERIGYRTGATALAYKMED